MSCATAGFEAADAVALLRLSDLYIESFEVKDVKVLVRSIATIYCYGGPYFKVHTLMHSLPRDATHSVRK